MKILIVNSLYYPNIVGGAEKSTRILAEGIKKKGLNPIVITTSDKDKIGYINGIKVYYVRIPNLYWMKNAKKQSMLKKPFWHLIDSFNIFVKKRISKILDMEKPDLIHTNNLTGFSVYTWKLAKEYDLPVIHTLRDYYLLCPRSTMFKNGKNCETQCLSCKFYSIPKKFSSNNVDTIVGVSKFILNKHLGYGYFKNAKIKTYIYNPVSISNNDENTIRRGNIKKIKFGFVGMLSPHKGIEFLLKRFWKMDVKAAKLYIFGRGFTKEYENYLMGNYSSDNIFFMGFKSQKEIYSLIDVLIVPSLWNEPFGRIIAESYFYGIPVIASNRGGIPEIVQEGKTGFIFEPEKEGDLEEKVRIFIDNPKLITKFSNNCLDFSKEFTEDKIINKYISLYQVTVK